VSPARFAGNKVPAPREDKSVFAAASSLWAEIETISLEWTNGLPIVAAFVLLTVIVDSPVIAEPGDTPRSPVSVVKPVLVTVEAPRTEKVVRSGPRIPSAFALGTEKEKTDRTGIRKEKASNLLTLRILLPLLSMFDELHCASVSVEKVLNGLENNLLLNCMNTTYIQFHIIISNQGATSSSRMGRKIFTLVRSWVRGFDPSSL
jgi:hypothetical protein